LRWLGFAVWHSYAGQLMSPFWRVANKMYVVALDETLSGVISEKNPWEISRALLFD
jgi:hypothetical protein